jgi:hypothetical protein
LTLNELEQQLGEIQMFCNFKPLIDINKLGEILSSLFSYSFAKSAQRKGRGD